MSEQRLRELMGADVTAAEREAEERGWAVVKAAYAERAAAPEPRSHRPLVLALAGAALLLALLMSPAGAQVREWIEDVVEPGVDHAAPALTRLPTEGNLVVESGGAAWFVRSDGSQRRLGDYSQATPSPRGAFVAATSGHQLKGVVADADNPLAAGDPAGYVRWAVSSKRRITDPAWSPSGYRVAYLAGSSLRVVAGDGAPDRLVQERVALVAPAWRPLTKRATPASDGVGTHKLAFVDTAGQVVVEDTDAGRIIRRWPVAESTHALAWSPDGRRLAAIGETAITILDMHDSAHSTVGVGGPGAIAGAAFLGETGRLAAVVSRPPRSGVGHSSVVLVRPGGRLTAPEPVFSTEGEITGPVPSPDGRWMQLGWRDADQWLFIRARGGKPEAVDNISRQFDPGATGPSAFPRVSGWCCGP
jgi:hypothetical protein